MEQIDRTVFPHPELGAAELLFEVGSLNVSLPPPSGISGCIEGPMAQPDSGMKQLMSLLSSSSPDAQPSLPLFPSLPSFFWNKS